MIIEFIALCFGIMVASWMICKVCNDGDYDDDDDGVVFGDD